MTELTIGAYTAYERYMLFDRNRGIRLVGMCLNDTTAM